MTSRTKLWALSAGALALSLALAGCGGGGSSSGPRIADPGTGGGGKTVVTTAVSLDDVTTTDAGYEAPAATGDTPLEIEAGMSATSGSVTFMCAADGDDCTVMVADDGAVTSTGGTVTAMNSEEFQTALNEAAEEKTEADTKAAGTKETAIRAEFAQAAADDAGLGGDGVTVVTDAATAAAGNYQLEIKRDRTGTTVTVTVHGATNDDDVVFEKDEDLTSSANPGQMHTRTHDADNDGNVVTEVAAVYTDIEAPKATPFAMVAGQALNGRDLDATEDADGDGTPDNDYTALNVVTGNVAQIKSSGFSSSGAGDLSYTFDNTGTEDTDEAFETTGTYNGAPGTYRCNGAAACTVTYDAKGAITAVTGDWVFTPDADATSDVPDADYLHYGFWLKRTADEDGVVTYNEVETFAGSSVAASTDVSTVQGTATYEGGAAGVYVHHVHSTGGGSIESSTSGHFTADASLTANFGGNRIPTADQNKLTGTIDNFLLSGGEENDWSVNLQGDIAAATGTVADGTAKGGVTGQDGSFNATFHGSVDADATTQVVPYPGSVVGEFNSFFSNGLVAGAFGARTED